MTVTDNKVNISCDTGDLCFAKQTIHNMAGRQLVTDSIAKAAQVIRNAQAIIVTAGSGIGVDSGLPQSRYGNLTIERLLSPCVLSVLWAAHAALRFDLVCIAIVFQVIVKQATSVSSSSFCQFVQANLGEFCPDERRAKTTRTRICCRQNMQTCHLTFFPLLYLQRNRRILESVSISQTQKSYTGENEHAALVRE